MPESVILVPFSLMTEPGVVFSPDLIAEGIAMEVLPPDDHPRVPGGECVFAIRVSGGDATVRPVDASGRYLEEFGCGRHVRPGSPGDIFSFTRVPPPDALAHITIFRSQSLGTVSAPRERNDVDTWRAAVYELLARSEPAAPPKPVEPADVALPPDYLAVVEAWGSFGFFGELSVSSPSRLVAEAQDLAGWFGDHDPPGLRFGWGAPLYPVSGGLLPWGRDEGGFTFFWLTEGAPDQWEVVWHDHEREFALRTRMCFAEFLLTVAEHELRGRWGDQLVDPRLLATGWSLDSSDVTRSSVGPYCNRGGWEPGRPYPIETY